MIIYDGLQNHKFVTENSVSFQAAPSKKSIMQIPCVRYRKNTLCCGAMNIRC